VCFSHRPAAQVAFAPNPRNAGCCRPQLRRRSDHGEFQPLPVGLYPFARVAREYGYAPIQRGTTVIADRGQSSRVTVQIQGTRRRGRARTSDRMVLEVNECLATLGTMNTSGKKGIPANRQMRRKMLLVARSLLQ
jgi:hypothetical protein